jgi:hypothetical protein
MNSVDRSATSAKVQEFLTDQIIQCVGKAEVFFDATRGRALFDPFTLELNP